MMLSKFYKSISSLVAQIGVFSFQFLRFIMLNFLFSYRSNKKNISIDRYIVIVTQKKNFAY